MQCRLSGIGKTMTGVSDQFAVACQFVLFCFVLGRIGSYKVFVAFHLRLTKIYLLGIWECKACID